MTLKLTVVVVLLALVLSTTDAGRRKKGCRNRPGSRIRGLPTSAEVVSSWTRTLITAEAQEVAFRHPDHSEAVLILSTDKCNLKQDGYAASKTLVDCTGGTCVKVLKVKKVKGCLLLVTPSDLTLQSVLDQLSALNGTPVAATTPNPIYLAPDRLEPTQASAMLARPSVSMLCGRKPIRAVTTMQPLSMAGTMTVKTTTLGEQLSITSTAREGRRGAGRGGRQGNRGERRRNRLAAGSVSV